MAQWFKRLQFWKNDPREKHGQTNLSIVDLFAQYRSAGDVGDNYQSQALEGYVKNVVALYVINTISLAVSNIPFFIRVGGQEVETSHPISKLIRRPNPGQTYKTLIREIIMNRMISGNCYLEALQLSNGSLRELYSLRPDRVRILTNSKEVPTGYEYRIGDKTISFPIDPLTRVSDLLHMKEPNPLDDCYGLSPIRAASFGISHHNSSSQWNVKLLDNYAKPAGIISIKSDVTGSIAPDQETLDKIGRDFNEKYSGSKNAGKVAFLSGGLSWQQMGFSPTDMDWINGKNSSARDIALAFGYPPFLLGLPEGATFSNVAEAKLSFYLDRVIPLTTETMEAIGHWLTQKRAVGEQEIEIVPDLDAVEALSPIRESMWEQSRKDFESGIIKLNEARKARGYDEIDGGDEVLLPAGKLPLNYQPGDLTDQQYKELLLEHGFSSDVAEKIIRETK